MPEESNQLFDGIRTFDSYATFFLSEDESIILSKLDYDKRIELFIAELKKDPEAIAGLEYLIVDEMQDLVGARARMVIEILKSIQCGFLLLGDRCQSIYDYLIRDRFEMNSIRFYIWLEELY